MTPSLNGKACSSRVENQEASSRFDGEWFKVTCDYGGQPL